MFVYVNVFIKTIYVHICMYHVRPYTVTWSVAVCWLSQVAWHKPNLDPIFHTFSSWRLPGLRKLPRLSLLALPPPPFALYSRPSFRSVVSELFGVGR